LIDAPAVDQTLNLINIARARERTYVRHIVSTCALPACASRPRNIFTVKLNPALTSTSGSKFCQRCMSARNNSLDENLRFFGVKFSGSESTILKFAAQREKLEKIQNFYSMLLLHVICARATKT